MQTSPFICFALPSSEITPSTVRTHLNIPQSIAKKGRGSSLHLTIASIFKAWVNCPLKKLIIVLRNLRRSFVRTVIGPSLSYESEKHTVFLGLCTDKSCLRRNHICLHSHCLSKPVVVEQACSQREIDPLEAKMQTEIHKGKSFLKTTPTAS